MAKSLPIKADRPYKTLSERIRGFLSPDPSSTALFVSTLLLVLFYRITLTYALLTRPLRPFDYTPTLHPLWFTIRYLLGDFAVVLLAFGFSRMTGLLNSSQEHAKKKGLGEFSACALLHLFLVALVLTHGVHGRLLFEGQTGLDLGAIKEGLANISPTLLFRLIEPMDALFLLLPFGVFWIVLLSPSTLRAKVAKISILVMILLGIGSGLTAKAHSRDSTPVELRMNPALFLLSDLADRALHRERTASTESPLPQKKDGRFMSLEADKGSAVRPAQGALPSYSGPWNVVFIVMESVGTRYVFDTEQGQPMPMPFLHELSKKGWFLKNHFSTSNLSTKALFSLMSGLYDLFRQESFGLRDDATVPSVFSLVPPHYTRFLVTPAPLSWFFPAPFVKNAGLSRIYSYENLKLPVREERHQSLGRYVARDEVETVDFFIEKLSEAKEPFLAVYVSFVAHFPYFDYGPDYEVRSKDARMICRYYNNLHLLDRMLLRIYNRLEKEEKLKRTILVIVGDHGQAFGQHRPDNFMHFRYSYNENLQAPAILYQPALFAAKVFEFPTSHVDLLPTLLEAMNIPCEQLSFDGESLFQTPLKRTSIFSYGHEGTMTSIDRNGLKVQYSLKKDRCWAFDLRNDPDEETPLSCTAYQEQLETLKAFGRYHDAQLLASNASWQEKKGSQTRSGHPLDNQ